MRAGALRPEPWPEASLPGKRRKGRREKGRKRGKAGKARGARPAPRKGTGAPPQTPPGGMISPGPPQFAVQGRSWRKGSPSTRCCARNPQAERPGIPDCGGYLSVSVSCRTRSRRPTPSRHSPGRRVKGKDFKTRGVERGLLPYSAPAFGKSVAQRTVFPFVCGG